MKKGHLRQFTILSFILLLIASCSFQRTDLHELAKSEPGIVVFADYLAVPNGSGEYGFGIMGVLDTGESLFTIQNNGNLTATISSLTLTNGDVSQFKIDTSSTSFTLAPGESTEFSIKFLPTESGDKEATVSIEIKGSSPYTFTVNGHGAASKIVVMQGSTEIPNGGVGYNFGSHEIGLPIETTFIVQNEGDFALRITGLLLSNSDVAQFALESDSLNSIVLPGQSTTFHVRYIPTKPRGVSTTLVLVCNDPDNTLYTFPLNGNGQSSSAIPPDMQVYLGPTPVPDKTMGYDFGNVQSGESSNPVTFTITNQGGAGALDLFIPYISIVTGDIDDFSVDTFETAKYVQEGERTTFTVLFEPQSTGIKQATVRIINDDPDMEYKTGYYEFTVKGNATSVPNPDIHVKVKDTGEDMLSGVGIFDFGIVWTGSTAVKSFTIENTGSADLTLSPPISITGLAFLNTFEPAITIGPGGSSDFEITFDPSVSGAVPYSETVSISSDDPDENPYQFTVQGTGNSTATADIAVLQNSVYIPNKSGTFDFGSVVMDTLKTVTFTIENNGSSGLNVNSITSNDTQFAFIGPTPITVPVGKTATFDITFNPQNTNNQKAKITLDNTDPDTPQYTFIVKGTGTNTEEPDIALWADGREITKDYKDFKDTVIGYSSLPVTFTIENRGAADLQISSIILTKGEKDFKIDLQGTSFLVPPNESTTFDIIFSPDQKAKQIGTLEIQSNDPDTDKLKISLEGTGLQ